MPLIELTGKRVPDRIPWSQIHKDTFKKMKKASSDATDNYLNTINWSKDFNMYTDASNHSISGVLAQSDSKGNDRPISFFSKKLTAMQKNWPVIDSIKSFQIVDFWLSYFCLS